MKLKLLSLMVSIALTSPCVFANEGAVNDTGSVDNQHASQALNEHQGEQKPVDNDLSALYNSMFGATDTIDKEYQIWFNESDKKTRAACQRKNKDLNSMECQLAKLVIYADAPVSGTPKDPDWIANRAAAFAEAQLKAYENYAQSMAITHQYTMMRKYVQDNTPIPDDPQQAQTKIGSMIDKVIAVGSAKLDQMLTDLGVDPKLYDQLPHEVRKTALQHLLQQSSKSRAMADISGLFPLKNFTATNQNGQMTVRVVLSKAPSRIEIAKLILNKGSRIVADPSKKNSKTLYDRYGNVEPKALFESFGARLVWDENGYPGLISFGQTDVPKGADQTEQQILVEGARTRAYVNALNSLTQMLNGTITSKITIQDGNEYLKEMVKQYSNNGAVLDQIIRTSTRKIKQEEEQKLNAQIKDFSGIVQLKQWSYIDPESRLPVVGAVLSWTPETAQAAEQMNDIRNRPMGDTTPEMINSENNNKNYKAATTNSIDTDDFEF